MISNKTRKDIRNSAKGITLVALTVTIIVLIILVGVSISLVLDENGIITKAREGRNNYAVAANEEDLTMKTFVNEMATLGGGGSSTPASTATYDTPYIPAGFTHTEGTWNNGYTIKGNAGTANANDEFVWVPCVLDASSYPSANNNTNTIKTGDSVTTFGKTLPASNSSSDPYYKYNQYNLGLLPTDTTVAEEDSSVASIETSVGTYGGFYIAKYEAGINETTDNYGLASGDRKATDGSYKPLSQAGKGVWNYISRTNAIIVSKAMVSTADGVHSTLISGAAWDTTLQWMVNTSDNVASNAGYDTNSSSKGWYSDNSESTRHLTGTSVATENANRVNNIWDMAGNVYEWTTENCRYDGNVLLVFRGR